jgi:hypothetical protein
MVTPTVETMVNGNADALAKNGRAEEKIAKGNNDAVRLIIRDQQIGVNPEGRARLYPKLLDGDREPTIATESPGLPLRTPHSKPVGRMCSASRTLLHRRRRERDRGSSPRGECERTRPGFRRSCCRESTRRSLQWEYMSFRGQ